MEGKRSKGLGIKSRWLLGSVGLLVFVLIVATILAPRFLSSINVRNILSACVSELAIASGMGLVFATGKWDLSFYGSTALGSVIFAYCCRSNIGLPVAILITLFFGAVIGIVNGLLCTLLEKKRRWLSVPASLLLGGLMYFVASRLGRSFGGKSFVPSERLRAWLIMGIPLNFVLLIVLLTLLFLLFGFTKGGKSLFTRGEHNRISNHAMNYTGIGAYCASGLLSAGAMVFFAYSTGAISLPVSDLLTWLSNVGALRILTILAIAGIGIPNLEKKKEEAFAGLANLVIAGLIVSIIRNALNLWGISSQFQNVIFLILFSLFVILNLVMRPSVIKGVEVQSAETEEPEGTDEMKGAITVNTGIQGGNKSKAVAALLAFFLGAVGGHRYYLGYTKQGLMQTGGLVSIIVGYTLYGSALGHRSSSGTMMVAGLLLLYGGVVGIWVFIDFIRILTGGLAPADGLGYAVQQVQVIQAAQEPSASDRLEALDKLAKLRDQGVLTEEEFQQKKADILAKM